MTVTVSHLHQSTVHTQGYNTPLPPSTTSTTSTTSNIHFIGFYHSSLSSSNQREKYSGLGRIETAFLYSTMNLSKYQNYIFDKYFTKIIEIFGMFKYNVNINLSSTSFCFPRDYGHSKLHFVKSFRNISKY